MAGGHPSPEAKIDIDNRRIEAARLKARGWSLHAIGLWLHADPARNSRCIAVPEGYGAGRYKQGRPPTSSENLAKDVSADLRQAFIARMTRFDECVDALRAMRIEQYENLLRAALAEARLDDGPDDDLEEDPKVVAAAADRRFRARDQALRVLTRLDEVQGVKRPVRQEHSGPDGGPIPVERVDLPELEALIAAAGDPSPSQEPDADQEETDADQD